MRRIFLFPSTSILDKYFNYYLNDNGVNIIIVGKTAYLPCWVQYINFFFINIYKNLIFFWFYYDVFYLHCL